MSKKKKKVAQRLRYDIEPGKLFDALVSYFVVLQQVEMPSIPQLKFGHGKKRVDIAINELWKKWGKHILVKSRGGVSAILQLPSVSDMEFYWIKSAQPPFLQKFADFLCLIWPEDSSLLVTTDEYSKEFKEKDSPSFLNEIIEYFESLSGQQLDAAGKKLPWLIGFLVVEAAINADLIAVADK